MRRFCVVPVLCLVLVVGCVQLTEQQRNDISELNSRLVQIQARISLLYHKVEQLADKIKAVIEKVARGQMPKEEGDRLIELFKQEKTVLETEIKAGIEDARVIGKTVKAINDSGVPWYQTLWLMLPGLAAGAAGIIRGNIKGSRAESIAGVLSRAGNVVAGFGGAVHKESKDSGVTRERVDEFWNRASNGDI